MTLRMSMDLPQPNAESSSTPQSLGYVEGHAVDRNNLPARLGPWPLKRNQSSCSTVVASSSSHSNSTGSSGDLTRVATPNAEDGKDGLRRRKSELTETMETVDRQCKAIQELLAAENAALRNNVEAAAEHTERPPREGQPQSQEVAEQAQQNVDVERGASAQPGGNHCENCEWLAKKSSRILSTWLGILFISMLGLMASPFIWREHFGREHAWEKMDEQQRKQGILIILAAPTVAYALAIAGAGWSMAMLYEKSRERPRPPFATLTTLMLVWTGLLYLYCSILLSRMME